MIESYKDLVVWQKAIDLVTKIYDLTKEFPADELYGLASQMRRSAVSIPSNIAEGYSRGHRPEYIQFIRIAFGSGAELETQLVIARKLSYSSENKLIEIEEKLEEVMKMLNAMRKALSSK